MDNLKGYLAPLGRLLMSSLFIWAGYHKLINPGGTAQYFANAHNTRRIRLDCGDHRADRRLADPGWLPNQMGCACACHLLPCHRLRRAPARGDLPNMINFYKNLVMAGGFLYVAAYGPGGISVDHATGMEKA
jgi:putative oxidoreductase